MLKRGKLAPLVYNMNDGVLHRRVVEGGQMFQPYMSRGATRFNRVHTEAAHDDSGHNGFPRTYSAIRRLYYWKGIKEDVTATLHQLLHLSTTQDCYSEVRSKTLQARIATNGLHRNGPYSVSFIHPRVKETGMH